jgi:hypothetical protein
MSDILVYGSDPSVTLQLSRCTITNNFCFSNNSQGIAVDTLGAHTEIIVQSNQCVTLDPATCTIGGTWLEIGSGSLTRRHGIVIGYNSNTVNGPRSIVANNICRNTGWTGIYVQAGPAGVTPGPVLVTGNLCSKNGIDVTENSSLSGGIWFSNDNPNTVVTGNVIDEMQKITAGGIFYIAATVSPAGPTISNNYILNSSGHGIVLTGRAANMNVVGNTIYQTALRDIYHQGQAGQPGIGGMVIEGNIIKRTNFAAESILLDLQNGIVVSTVRNNYIKGHDKTTGGSVDPLVLVKNAGIKTGNNAFVRVTGNIVNNFHVAISFSSYWVNDTRHFNADLNNNTIRDCITGFGIAATANNAVVPVTGNVFDGVTNNISASSNASAGGSLAGYVARKDNNRIVVLDRVNAAPTVGVWAVGDRVEFTTPTAGGFLGAVCTALGTPGTWKTYGAITA